MAVAVLGRAHRPPLLWLGPAHRGNLGMTASRRAQAFKRPQVSLTLSSARSASAACSPPRATSHRRSPTSPVWMPALVPIFLLASGIGWARRHPTRRTAGGVVRPAVDHDRLRRHGGQPPSPFALTAQWSGRRLIFFYFLSSVLAPGIPRRRTSSCDSCRWPARHRPSPPPATTPPLNTANALGAWLGGIVIANGLGYTAHRAGSEPACPSSPASLVLLASATLHRRTAQPAVGAGPRRELVVARPVSAQVPSRQQACCGRSTPDLREAGALQDAAGGGVVDRRRTDHQPVQPQPAVLDGDEAVPHSEPRRPRWPRRARARRGAVQ